MLCPTTYPHYNNAEDNFFVEVGHGLELWGNALNEYLLDTDRKVQRNHTPNPRETFYFFLLGRLSLTSVLTKGLSLYSSADASSASGAEAGAAAARPSA